MRQGFCFSVGLSFVLNRVIKRWALALTGLALCVWHANALAQGYGALAAHYKITQIHHVEEIAEDYSVKRKVSIERLALSNEGTTAIGKVRIGFNSDLESVEVLEAYTEKADGAKIPVPSNGIHVQKGVLAAGTQISLPNQHILQITFPQVQPGDKTHVRFVQNIQKPMLPKWLAYFDFLSNELDTDVYKAEVSAPESIPLQIHAQGLTLQTHTTQGRKHWSISGQSTSFASEQQLANGLKYLAHWMYSTLPTRTALAEAYTQSTREKMTITPELQALADRITQGQATPYTKAQAIYRWITKEVRYVAQYIGAGGYVPNDVISILKNRYGDCKDHVLLMMALLQAVGIESAPALINTAHTDIIPPVAAPIYNHVLVYLPLLDLFVDPTAHSIPFGALPWSDSAKPVLVGLQGGAREMRTPAFKPETNRVHVRSTWRIDAQGSAQVDLKIQTQGEAATEMQNQLAQIPSGFSSAAVDRLLKASGFKGKGFLQYPAVQRERQEQSLSAQIEVQQLVSTPEAGSLNPHPVISSLPVYAINHLGPVLDDKRRFDMLCTPILIEEDFELHLPPGTQILSIPQSVRIEASGIRYNSEYTTTGTSITGQRRFERHATASGHICTLSDIAQRRPSLDAVRKNLRSTVLFKAS